MGIAYANDLTVETRDRERFRYVLHDAGMWIAAKSPLEKLLDGKAVPAKTILAELERLRYAAEHGSALFRMSGTDGPKIADVDDFIAYTKRQIADEAIQAKMKRLIRDMAGLGYSYPKAAKAWTQALDKFEAESPETLAPHAYGWG